MGYGNEFFCRCQEAFLNYCSKKRLAVLQKRYQQQSSRTVRSDPDPDDTAKPYIGVPYAKNLKKFPSCEC